MYLFHKMKIINLFVSLSVFCQYVCGIKTPIPSRRDAIVKAKPMPRIKTLPGAIPPLGFWDPLNLTDKADDRLVLYFREAEQQHGRLAMLSMVALPTIDLLDKTELAINFYNDCSKLFVSKEMLIGMILVECARISVLYDDPSQKMFRLKDSAYPGNLFQLNMELFDTTLIDKELSNGRLAMVAALGYMVQELVTQTKIL